MDLIDFLPQSLIHLLELSDKTQVMWLSLCLLLPGSLSSDSSQYQIYTSALGALVVYCPREKDPITLSIYLIICQLQHRSPFPCHVWVPSTSNRGSTVQIDGLVQDCSKLLTHWSYCSLAWSHWNIMAHTESWNGNLLATDICCCHISECLLSFHTSDVSFKPQMSQSKYNWRKYICIFYR